MKTGTIIGGPIANPIREMLYEKSRDGVIFDCKDEKKAENTRYAALMLKRRNDYSFKTMRKGCRLIIYKSDADPYELRGASRVYLDKDNEKE